MNLFASFIQWYPIFLFCLLKARLSFGILAAATTFLAMMIIVFELGRAWGYLARILAGRTRMASGEELFLLLCMQLGFCSHGGVSLSLPVLFADLSLLDKKVFIYTREPDKDRLTLFTCKHHDPRFPKKNSNSRMRQIDG